jgi:hypothetical protein
MKAIKIVKKEGNQKSNKEVNMIRVPYMHVWKYHNKIPL